MKKLSKLFFRSVRILGILKLKPVVFLHLQKTAGTSIVDMARQFYGNDNVISHGDYLYNEGRLTPAEKFAQAEFLQSRFGNTAFISGHFGYDFAKQFMVNRFSFTFLRNPVERVLSAYYFYRTRNPDEFRHYKMAQSMPLDDFLMLGLDDPDIKAHIWNYQVTQLATGWGAVSNLSLDNDSLLQMAIDHLDDFSYVGFTETFAKDQEYILKAIGISIPVGNYKSNVNPGRPLFDGLPESSKDLLLKLTELDRQLYEIAWEKYNSPRLSQNNH